MLNERTYPTPDSGLTHLFPRSRAVVAYTVVHLVTPDCAPVELSTRYTTPDNNDRDRQYECDRGIKADNPVTASKGPRGLAGRLHFRSGFPFCPI